MKRGSSAVLPFRSPTRQILSLRFYNAPHAQTSTHPTSIDPMLGRARDKKAAEPAPKAPTNNALKNQLFPSSSPIPVQKPGSITDHFKKPGVAPSTASFRGYGNPTSNKHSAPTAPPLKTQSANIARDSGAHRQHAWGGHSVAALCSKSDSFSEAPQIVSSVEVFIGEDDFSDDGDLDLDFQQPTSLPSLPTQTKPLPRNADAAPMSNTSVMSWSQSSPSHMAAPKAPIKQEPRPPMKRESPTALNVSKPAKKPRTMPASFRRKQEVIEIDDLDDVPSVTPARKHRDPLLMDATASVIKDKKNLMKQRNKKPTVEAADEGEAPAEVGAGEHKPTTSKGENKPITNAITLSKEQAQVRDMVCKNKTSVFFTGPAGTGKSVLMRSIIQELKKKWKKTPERLAVTASTGLAACNIGGMTLHSFAGIGLGKEEVGDLVKKIRRNAKAKNRWLQTHTLIIDEVSMVDGELFDKLSQIGRAIRNNGRPWGGIQLVITGDFFQLPPVPEGSGRTSKFAFEAATWNTSIDHTIGLTEVFRQKDPVFAQMLNEMRLGTITDDTLENFRSLSRPLEFDDGLEVTELFPTRNEVDSSNMRRLKALPGKSRFFQAGDSGSPEIRDRLLQNMMAPKAIELKKGAQVMLIKNMDESLVNGSLGTVIGFMTEGQFEISGGADEDELDGMHPDVKKRIQAFTRQLSGGPEAQEYPLVRFHAADGTQRTVLTIPEEWKVELPTGEVQASRKQLPLILAWALSIHKAQGQTLERVKVDLGKVFEKGQAYVALSRATSQQGLQVLRFQKGKVMAHPRVVQFYNQLYSVDAAKTKRTPAPTLTNYTKALTGPPPPVAATKKASAPPVAKQQPPPPAVKKPNPIQRWEVDEDEEEMAAMFGH